MKKTILLLAALTLGALHAGTEERRFVVPSSEMASAIKASISGIKDQGEYPEIPPILVDITGSTKSSRVWVELREGANDSTGGERLEARVVCRKADRKTLYLPTLNQICAAEGTWTLRVMTGTGLNVRSLAVVTFEVDHDQAVSAAPANFPGDSPL